MSRISQIVLATTGFYCYCQVKHEIYIYAPCSYLVILANSVLGVWREIGSGPSIGTANHLFKYTSILQDLVVLPCIVSAVWTRYGHLREIAFTNVLIAFIPAISYILDKTEISDNLRDGILMLNCAVLSVVSVVHLNLFGLAASAIYAFNHFSVKINNETILNFSSPDLYNYALSFFALCSLHAIV